MSLGFQWEVFVVKIVGLMIVERSTVQRTARRGPFLTVARVGSAALWILWNCRGWNCVIVLLLFSPFLWPWLEARGFFIDYSAGFRLRHSGG